ncbi:hypothetical protein UFOVP276_3 [uncultured Caudovirales phage]|uniref:Uncharacterized protein n=1 Tax=uncultured Caudovirales phage TaxID=2100421 RepID=A0A6J5LDT8_9CAUD|nr:hypothetical protein UFOVP127_140 [uncultured Caudovirales phage]CAB4134731.1 hypothetical protein UFOVP276_3 [uncultured Caudovirales phage]
MAAKYKRRCPLHKFKKDQEMVRRFFDQRRELGALQAGDGLLSQQIIKLSIIVKKLSC